MNTGNPQQGSWLLQSLWLDFLFGLSCTARNPILFKGFWWRLVMPISSPWDSVTGSVLLDTAGLPPQGLVRTTPEGSDGTHSGRWGPRGCNSLGWMALAWAWTYNKNLDHGPYMAIQTIKVPGIFGSPGGGTLLSYRSSCCNPKSINTLPSLSSRDIWMGFSWFIQCWQWYEASLCSVAVLPQNLMSRCYGYECSLKGLSDHCFQLALTATKVTAYAVQPLWGRHAPWPGGEQIQKLCFVVESVVLLLGLAETNKVPETSFIQLYTIENLNGMLAHMINSYMIYTYHFTARRLVYMSRMMCLWISTSSW